MNAYRLTKRLANIAELSCLAACILPRLRAGATGMSVKIDFIYNPKSEKVGTVWKMQIKKESSDF